MTFYGHRTVVSFEEVLKALVSSHSGDWIKEVLNRARVEILEWEYRSLTRDEALRIVLSGHSPCPSCQDSVPLTIPTWMTVASAAALNKNFILPYDGTPVILSDCPIRQWRESLGLTQTRLDKESWNSSLIWLDGVHRLTGWANTDQSIPVQAYIAKIKH